MSPLQTYYDDEGNLVFDSADGNTYIVDETDTRQVAAFEQQEAGYQQEAVNQAAHQQYLQELESNVRQFEQQIGRPVTESEFQKSIAQLEGDTDFQTAYREAYPQNRAANEDDRQALMREAMDDATAEQDAAESGEQYAEGYE